MNRPFASRIVVLLMIAGTLTACERRGETSSTTSSGTTSSGSNSTGSNPNGASGNSDPNRGTTNQPSTVRPTPAMTPPATPGTPGTPGTSDKTPMDQSESPAQIAITAEIRKSIMADKAMSMNAQNCKIITDKTGLVTLRGKVDSQAEKNSIEAKAKAVSGVTMVDNQLEVKTN